MKLTRRHTSFRQRIALLLTILLCLSIASIGAVAEAETVTLIPENTPDNLRPSGDDVRAIGKHIAENNVNKPKGPIDGHESIKKPRDFGISIDKQDYTATITVDADVYVAYVTVGDENAYTKYMVPDGILRADTSYIAYAYWYKVGDKEGNAWHNLNHVVLFGSGELVNPPPTTGSLQVTKTFKGVGDTIPEGFEADFLLQRMVEDEWTGVSSVAYSDFNAGNTHTFTGLLPGQYRVVEETPSNAGNGNALSEALAADNQLYWDGATYCDGGDGVEVVDAETASITVTNNYQVKTPSEEPFIGQLRVTKVFADDRTTMPEGFKAEFNLQQWVEGAWNTLEDMTAIYSDDEDNDFTDNSYLFTELPSGLYRIQEVITNHGDGIAASLAVANRRQMYWSGATYSDGQNGVELAALEAVPMATDQVPTQSITVTNNYDTRPSGGSGPNPPTTREPIERPENVVDIPDEEAPLADASGEEEPMPEVVPEEEPILQEVFEEEPIPEAALDHAPKTDGKSNLGLWILLASASLFSLVGALVMRRRQYKYPAVK